MATTKFSDEAYKLALVAATMYPFPQDAETEMVLTVWVEAARDLVAACQAELNGKKKDDGKAF